MRHPGGRVRYFHKPETRELWAIPEAPELIERMETVTKRRKNPKRTGWTAYAEIVHIRADNWIRPDTNQWHYAHTRTRRENFDAHYQADDVRSYFNNRNWFVPGEEISRDEFDRLRAEYEALAERNPVPSPLPLKPA